MNKLERLKEVGQSFWLDFISRDFIQSGELSRWINENGLRGVTSNPTIFKKSMSEGESYADDIHKYIKENMDPETIFDHLVIGDIRRAADALDGVYRSSHGSDGFVSLEVNPHLAEDDVATVKEAERLFRKVGKSNLMVKIPATEKGLGAIEQCLYEGININITLLFSVDVYKKVIRAYFQGLKRRVAEKLPVQGISSVASFFVSRIDTKVDRLLDEQIKMDGANAVEAPRLLHKAGIDNAKMAYRAFQESMNSPEWSELKNLGALPQRLLWGSTGTKDSRLSDVHYINGLIGPETVNTMPMKTAEAFRDHGVIAATVTEDASASQERLEKLRSLGVDIEQIANNLLKEGIEAFQKSYDGAVDTIRETVAAQTAPSA